MPWPEGHPPTLTQLVIDLPWHSPAAEMQEMKHNQRVALKKEILRI